MPPSFQQNHLKIYTLDLGWINLSNLDNVQESVIRIHNLSELPNQPKEREKDLVNKCMSHYLSFSTKKSYRYT
jgi:hypothetical protein